MALWGESGVMIDACMYLPLMNFICNLTLYEPNNYKQNRVLYVQATLLQLHEYVGQKFVIPVAMYVMKAGILIVKHTVI